MTFRTLDAGSLFTELFFFFAWNAFRKFPTILISQALHECV